MKTIARIAMLLAALCALAGPMHANAAGSEVRLNPAFHPDTLSYTATVPHGLTEVVMDLSAEHPKATVTVNGKAPDTPVKLAVGENTITIRVVAEDARYTRAYTVVVTRLAARSKAADLSGLAAEAGTDGAWSALDIGAFDADTTAYTATVPHATTHARLTATAADADATLSGGAAVALDEGANALAMEVTAGDGTARTYTVTVTREAPLSSNADLSGLEAESRTDGAWSALDIGAFDADTTAYTATVPHATTHARLTATASDANATFEGGAAVALDVGANALAVEVTAADGTAKTYTVTVTREVAPLSSNADLSGLEAESGTDGSYSALDIGAFDADTTGYTATVPYATTHARLTATASDADATFEDGAEVALDVGANALAVEVTAADGTAKTYTVTVTREARVPLDTDLRWLLVQGASNGAGPWAKVNFAFAPETTEYAITVPHRTTVGRVLATPEFFDGATHRATLRSGFGTDMRTARPGFWSRGYALSVGSDNVFSVEVTAADGAKKTYTVRVTREAAPLSSNADLSGLEAEAGTDGSYSALDIGGFSADTTGYTATVPYETTHARLTATAAHADASLSVGGAVALDVGANALTVEVTAEDGTKKTYTVTVEREAPPKPLTASFGNVPATHDGETMFTIDVRFSESLGDGSAPAPESFDVAFGTAKAVELVEAGLYRVSVKPKSHRDATVTLAGGRDCSAAGAVCTADGRALENTSTATVGGPVRIRIEGGMAREGKHATLDFAVSLDRAAAHPISVDYATADRTATAGADYEAASGTLTFAPGETAATVTVAILDDEVDEGKETFELHLSNARGAYLRNTHRKATGTIRNTDAMPAAFLARFGRAATDHVVDALDARFDDASFGTAREVRLGGVSLFGGPDAGGGAWGRGGSQGGAYGAPGGFSAPGGPFGRPGGFTAGAPPAASGSAFGALGHGPGGAGHAAPQGPAASGTQDDVLRNLLLGSSFRASLGGGESGRRLTAWGRAAGSFFSGEDQGVAVEGDAATVMLGADAAWNRWLAGVALARTTGAGSYQGAAGAGELTGTLTAVHPYARFRVTDRLSAWGTLGWGEGDLDLETVAGGDWRTPTAMRMGAGGLRGVLLRRESGLELAGRMDARFTRMTSESASGATGELAGASGDANRLRLLVEGSRPFSLGAQRTLTPSVEIGLRHDGGDAETGMGLELGGALRYVDARLGLAVDVAGRRLAAHADGGYGEWGASATVTVDPGASGRGLSLRLAPAWGAEATGGAERLWSMADARGLAGHTPDAGLRLAGDVAWGLDAFGGRGSMAPYVGMARSAFGRDWRAGVRWTRGPAMEFGFEATRAQSPAAEPSHGLLLRFAWRPVAGLLEGPRRGPAQ